jgi:hypothetical protein
MTIKYTTGSKIILENVLNRIVGVKICIPSGNPDWSFV